MVAQFEFLRLWFASSCVQPFFRRNEGSLTRLKYAAFRDDAVVENKFKPSHRPATLCRGGLGTRQDRR